MTDVAPFRALRFDPKRVDLGRVLAPPYDVVTAEERALYYDRDPHNAIRLELTRTTHEESDTDYAGVSETLASWKQAGILRRDPAESLYVLRQRFKAPGLGDCERLGFFGALGLEDYERRVVLPHERTLSGPKQDRLKLLRATRANLSPVFLLYEDREQALAGILESALADAEGPGASDAAGIEHTLAALTDPEAVRALRSFLAERSVVIADGHHRYETALAYRNERREAAGSPADGAPYERTLAYFSNAFAPGTLLLPIHRLILKGPAPTEATWRRLLEQSPAGSREESLSGWEELQVPVSGEEAIAKALETHLAPLADRVAFAADDGSGTLRIFSRPSDGELAVRVLHREVLDGVFGLDDDAVRDGAVAFPKSAQEAARAVREGQGSLALYLEPLSPDDVFRVTGAGELLPQKSTFFTPKLPTGLVFRDDEGGD